MLCLAFYLLDTPRYKWNAEQSAASDEFSTEALESYLVPVLLRPSLESIARIYSLDFIAIFGSTARDGAGRDVDVAVMPAEPLREFASRTQLYEDLSEAYAPALIDLAVLPSCSWLLGWQVARDGKAVFGQVAFERFLRTRARLAVERRRDGAGCYGTPSAIC